MPSSGRLVEINLGLGTGFDKELAIGSTERAGTGGARSAFVGRRGPRHCDANARCATRREATAEAEQDRGQVQRIKSARGYEHSLAGDSVVVVAKLVAIRHSFGSHLDDGGCGGGCAPAVGVAIAKIDQTRPSDGSQVKKTRDRQQPEATDVGGL